MIYPLRTELDDNPHITWPVANLVLIAFTILVSLFLLGNERLLVSSALWRGDAGYLPQLISHAFAHGGIGHLLGNMLFLFAFGNALNRRLGHAKYVGLYLAGALCGGLGWLMFGGGNAALGASAAAMCIAGAVLVLLPRGLMTLAGWLLLMIAGVLSWVVARTLPLVGFLGNVGPSITQFMTILLVILLGCWWTGMLFRPWNRLSRPERLGRFFGFVCFQASAVWVVGILIFLDVLSLGDSDGVGHVAHLAGAITGIVLGMIANATGVVRGRLEEPTLLEWAGLLESDVSQTDPSTPPVVIPNRWVVATEAPAPSADFEAWRKTLRDSKRLSRERDRSGRLLAI